MAKDMIALHSATQPPTHAPTHAPREKKKVTQITNRALEDRRYACRADVARGHGPLKRRSPNVL
jgi:hypothetical protein